MSLAGSATLPELLAPPPYFSGPKAEPQHRTWRSKASDLKTSHSHTSFLLPGPSFVCSQNVDGHQSSRTGGLSLPPVKRAAQRRGLGEHVDSVERDHLVENLGGFRRNKRHGASGMLEAFLPHHGNVEERAARARTDPAEEKRGYISEIEALKRRCSELEESLAKEKMRRVKAEEALQNGAQAVSMDKRTVNLRAVVLTTSRAETARAHIMRSALFSAWRTRASEAHAHVEARQRALGGGSSWAAASERADLVLVLAVWQASVAARRQMASMQTKLFAEEACRGEALRMQQLVLEAAHMEADATHRKALRRLRIELVQAEARRANDLAMHEASTYRREPDIFAGRRLNSTGASAGAPAEDRQFLRATAEFLQEQQEPELDLEDSQLEFALVAAELLREQELDDSFDEEQV